MSYSPSLSSISNFFDCTTNMLRHDQKKQMEDVHGFFNNLVSLFKEKIKNDLHLASDFNVFDYIQPDEMKLSRIIADLLNPKGAHGQQRRFLAAFVEAMMEEASESLRATLTKLQEAIQDDTCAIIVQTEAMTWHGRRMDILVDIGGQKGIVIENKPWANDQKEALKDYADEAAKRFSDGWVLIYLHGSGKAAGEYTLSKKKRQELEAGGNFLDADYTYFLIRWLKICRDCVEAEKVCWFLYDFIGYVENQFQTNFLFAEDINNA